MGTDQGAAAGGPGAGAEVPDDGPDDGLVVAGERLGSRVLLGTGGMASLDALDAALDASGAAMATVAVRRVDPSGRGALLDVLSDRGVRVLPNTAGCFTAADAVLTAKLAREAFATHWVKLEVIGDDRTLLPDRSSCWWRPNSWSTKGSWCCLTPRTTRWWPGASSRSGAPR